MKRADKLKARVMSLRVGRAFIIGGYTTAGVSCFLCVVVSKTICNQFDKATNI